MRLSHTVWATAALAAAGIGYLAGIGTESNSTGEYYTAIPAISQEECDGLQLSRDEPIDLSCVEAVLPYDLFAHTSEPPLAAPLPQPVELRQVGFDIPDIECFPDIVLPSLPQIPASEGDRSPGRLPAGIEREGTELTVPVIPLGHPPIQTVSGTVPQGGTPSGGGCSAGCCPCCQCPCCARPAIDGPVKPLPPGWFVGPPAPDGWIGPE